MQICSYKYYSESIIHAAMQISLLAIFQTMCMYVATARHVYSYICG